MQPQFILKSWTFWFGVAQVVTAVFGAFSHNLDSQAAMSLLVTGLGTIGLRFKTQVPITFSLSASKKPMA